MDFLNMIISLSEGLAQNFLITALSVIAPLGLGFLFTYLASLSRTSSTVFSWISLPFECICPISLLLVNCFVVFPGTREALLVAIITFSICFLGYMPARYQCADSFLKNCLYNGLGLISTVFKWSLCVGYVGIIDLQQAANILQSRTFNGIYTIFPLICTFFVLVLIEVGRRLIKQLMR